MFSPYLSVNNGREDGRLPGPQPLSLREVIPGSDLEREGMRRPTSAGGRVWDASEPGRSATLVAHLAGAAESGCGPLCGHVWSWVCLSPSKAPTAVTLAVKPPRHRPFRSEIVPTDGGYYIRYTLRL